MKAPAWSLTKKRGGAGGRVIHAYQGGGPGLQGLYIDGLTWCGVENRSSIALVGTDKEPNCRACLGNIAAHEQSRK